MENDIIYFSDFPNLQETGTRSPVSCDKTDGGAADGRGAAAVRPCGDFCTDAGVWKAAVAVYR